MLVIGSFLVFISLCAAFAARYRITTTFLRSVRIIERPPSATQGSGQVTTTALLLGQTLGIIYLFLLTPARELHWSNAPLLLTILWFCSAPFFTIVHYWLGKTEHWNANWRTTSNLLSLGLLGELALIAIFKLTVMYA